MNSTTAFSTGMGPNLGARIFSGESTSGTLTLANRRRSLTCRSNSSLPCRLAFNKSSIELDQQTESLNAHTYPRSTIQVLAAEWQLVWISLEIDKGAISIRDLAMTPSRIHLNGFDGQGSKRAKLCLLMRWDENFITHGHALQLLAPEEEHVPAGQGEQYVPALEF